MDVVALCDSHEDRRTLLLPSTMTKAQSFKDYKDLASLEIDAVVVCTPHNTHAEIANYFLRRQIHVFVEKPMATSSRDAYGMIALARSEGTNLIVTMQRRFQASVRCIREAFHHGILGELLCASSQFHLSRDDAYYRASDWRGRADSEIGALFTFGPHFIDAVGYVAGFPELCCFCQIARLRRDHAIDDTGSAIFRLPSGGPFSVNWSTLASRGGQLGQLSFVFERCTIVLGGEYFESIDFLGGDSVLVAKIRELFAEYAGSLERVDELSQHREFYKAACRSLVSGAKDDRLSGPDDAAKVVGLLEQAYACAAVREQPL